MIEAPQPSHPLKVLRESVAASASVVSSKVRPHTAAVSTNMCRSTCFSHSVHARAAGI